MYWLLQAMQTKVYAEGPVTVDNEEHSDFTVVTILVAQELEGALLKVTSALANSGCSIQEGFIEVSLLPCLGCICQKVTSSSPGCSRTRAVSPSRHFLSQHM